MAIDNTYYRVYYQSNAEYKYRLTYGNANELIRLLIEGTLTNYQVGDFFQQNSDYVTRILFLPFYIMHFFPEYNTNYKDDTLHIGKLDATVITTQNLMRPLPSLKLFEFSVARKFNNFLDFAPYRKLKLFVPYFKEVELDAQLIYGKTIKGYMAVDFTNGDTTLYIYACDENNEYLIEAINTKLGIEVSIGKTNAEEKARNRVLNGIEIVGSVLGTAVGLYTGNAFLTAGAISKGAQTITKVMANEVSRLTGYNGSTGTRNNLPIDKEIYLIDEYPTIIYDVDKHLQGKPLQEVKTLSTLSGYTKVGDIHFNPMGEDIYNSEIDEIVSLLQNGVIL